MKVSLSFSVLVLSVCVLHCSGIAVRQSKPIKFLVLQKSDILSDVNVLVNKPDVVGANQARPQVAASGEEAETTTTATVSTTDDDDTDEDVQNDGVETTTIFEAMKPWNPVDGWTELNFTVVPEGTVSPNQEPTGPPPPLDFTGTNANISRGGTQSKFFVGRQACQCGRPKTRIVNGDPARHNDIPWTVALARNGFFGFGASKKPYCGGTLINDRYVATASHCVDAMFAGGIKVWLNEDDLLSDSETGPRQVYDVQKIIMHPQYDRRTVNYDIALLKLGTPVPISIAQDPKIYVTPACIPINNDEDFSGLNGTVAGWGVTSQGGSLPNTLMKVEVPIITNEVCNRDTQYTGKITENMMCAGFIETGGKDSCQGDSGGPFIIPNNDRKTLVGIVSWGYGCAQAKAPGVYTRVARFPEWILENTKDAEWCSE